MTQFQLIILHNSSQPFYDFFATNNRHYFPPSIHQIPSTNQPGAGRRSYFHYRHIFTTHNLHSALYTINSSIEPPAGGRSKVLDFRVALREPPPQLLLHSLHCLQRLPMSRCLHGARVPGRGEKEDERGDEF